MKVSKELNLFLKKKKNYRRKRGRDTYARTHTQHYKYMRDVRIRVITINRWGRCDDTFAQLSTGEDFAST